MSILVLSTDNDDNIGYGLELWFSDSKPCLVVYHRGCYCCSPLRNKYIVNNTEELFTILERNSTVLEAREGYIDDFLNKCKEIFNYEE